MAHKRVGASGRVFALDLLPMEPIPGVEFMQGDFHDEVFVERFEEMLGGRQVDLVMSDIAPNISGIPSSDQARSIYLAELALDFAQKHLAAGALCRQSLSGGGVRRLPQADGA